MAEVKWIKICTDIFNDEKILLIESMPEADSIIAIWFKLLCMAGKQNNGGVFMLNDKMPYTEEMFATIFRRPLNTVRLALSTFENFGMVEIVNNAYTIPNWEKHQSLDKLEQAKEKNRQRVAAHREKQKLLAQCNDYSNVTVTPSNAVEEDIDIDIDKDIEKEEEKDIKKESKKKASKPRSYDDILSQIADDSLRDLYLEYIKMRKMIKAPMTDRALTMLIKIVDELEPTDIDRKKRLLETAIMNNWKSVYPLKEEPKEKHRSFNTDEFFNAAVKKNKTIRVDDDPELKAEAEALKKELAEKY